VPDNNVLTRQITVDMIHQALNLVTFHHGERVEAPELPCAWKRLCDENYCRFPKYFRNGSPTGLTAHVLMELGYPSTLLRDLDCEYEVGEVLHPGVKIGRSRNAALGRIDRRGIALLAYLQDHQKVGWSWSDIADKAFQPRWMIARLDKRRRPWLY
jgi:hypothetical protein